MKRTALALGALMLVALPAFATKDGTPAEVRDDFERICNVKVKSHADKAKDSSEQARLMADYLMKNIKTDQAMKAMQTLATASAADKGPALKKAAANAGYTGRCPLVDDKE